MSDLLEAALGYVARGWKVIPLHGIVEGRCTCGHDHNDGRGGKHPILSGTFDKVATADASVVRGWWTKYPNANVGIACGESSGVWVLDIDPDGFADLDEYETVVEPIDTLRAQTGRGGWHFFFKWSPDDRVKSRNAARVGVDVKSDGGYVCAPPSRHANGNVYSWVDARHAVHRPTNDILKWIKSGPSGNGDGGGSWQFPSIIDMLRDGIPEGQRDDALFHAALKQLDAGMKESEVRATIKQIAARCTPAFPPADAQRKVDAAQSFRLRRLQGDETPPELNSWARTPGIGEQPSPAVEPADEPVAELDFRRTDLANAQRLARAWPDCSPLSNGGWIVIKENTMIWAPNPNAPTLQAANVLSDVIRQEAVMLGADDASKHASFALNSENDAKVRAALRMWASDPSLCIREEWLDANPWVLSFISNLLDLKTGVLRGRMREDLITKMTNCDWEGQDMDCPFFKQTMLLGTSGQDEELQVQTLEALQMFFGVCLTGVPLKNFVILNGPGNSGKSSVVEGFARAMGVYASAAPRGLLTSRPGKIMDHPTIYKTLQGKRFMYGSEPGVGEELNIDLIKDITSGGEIVARGMGENFSSFVAHCKLLVDTNNWLKFRETTKALEERMIILDFPTEIPAGDRKSRDIVRSKLDAEASGVLAWAYRGLLKVLLLGGEDGVGDLTPLLGERLLERRREAVSEQDVVGRYVAEKLVQGMNEDFVSKEELLTSIQIWMALNGVKWNSDPFLAEVTRRLRSGPADLVVKEERIRVEGARRRGWMGLRLAGPAEA